MLGLVLCADAPSCQASLFQANLTTNEERELGREFMHYMKKHLALIEDPDIVGYVNKVGQYIVSQYPPQPFQFDFSVVKEDVYNAFAGPGGHVFIYSGLIAAMDSEEQLAGILAHEIGHVFARHISKQIEASKKIGLATMAGILAGIFLGGSPAATSAIASTSMAAGKSMSLRFSRQHEMEADQLGLKYLHRSGYSGKGLLKALQTIRQKQWFGTDQIPSYLTTHPAVEARMAYLDTWIHAHPDWKPSTTPPILGNFNQIKTKLIALYADMRVAQNILDARLRANPKDALACYGKGLLLDREGDKQQAVAYLEKAARLDPADAFIVRDLGKSQFNMGDYGAALETLGKALSISTKDPEGLLLLGRAQMMTDNPQGALETFKMLLAQSPGYLPGTYYLGETYGKLGHLAEAHYHLGLYYKEKGPAKTARFHLQRALQLSSRDPARQALIRKALKELSADKKDEHKDR